MDRLGSKRKKKQLNFRINDNFERLSIKIMNKPDVNILDNEKVMVDFNTGKYFVVKGAGNDIWDMIQDGVKVGFIVENLLNKYEVSRKNCIRQTAIFMNQLEEYGFIQLY